MGYKLPKRTAVIVFEEGHEYAGAEVRCALDVPLRTVLLFRRMQSGEAEDIERGYELFAKEILVRWNIEDEDGNAIPCDAEAFMGMPLAFLNAVTAKWIEAVAGVPKDSAPLSLNGSTLAEEFAPTGA